MYIEVSGQLQPLVQLGQEEGADDRTQGTAKGNPPIGFPEEATPLGGPPQILLDQIQDTPVVDDSGQPLDQALMVDGSVVGFHIGPDDEPVSL